MKIMRIRNLSITALSLVVFAPFAAAQVPEWANQALLHDGRILNIALDATLHPEMFETEGPITHVQAPGPLGNNPDQASLHVMGRTVIVPAAISYAPIGAPVWEPLTLFNTNDGAGGEITSATMWRLLDENAVAGGAATDAALGLTGACRSIVNTARADSEDAARYTTMHNHAATCSAAAALGLGVADPLDATDVTQWFGGRVTMTGGTLKSAGNVFTDPNVPDGLGNRYFICDIDRVIELAENVATGHLVSWDRASNSFLVGNVGGTGSQLVCTMNTDPRSPRAAMGFMEIHMTVEEVFDALEAGAGELLITLIGHTIGDNFMMVNDLITDFVPAGFVVGVQRIRIRPNKNELRIRGGVANPLELLGGGVLADFFDVNGTLITGGQGIAFTLNADPLEPLSALITMRLKPAPFASGTVQFIDVYGIKGDGSGEIGRERFDVDDFLR